MGKASSLKTASGPMSRLCAECITTQTHHIARLAQHDTRSELTFCACGEACAPSQSVNFGFLHQCWSYLAAVLHRRRHRERRMQPQELPRPGSTRPVDRSDPAPRVALADQTSQEEVFET